jgi:hypothetical protein
MIDRTEHDAAKDKTKRETIDEDVHADHSLDPDEHYGQESDIPTEEELRERAEADAPGR